jgi:serine/threonine protein kinase
MGSCLSGFAPIHLIESVDGDEDDYQHRFLEDNVLGEGEFGIVKLVHDMTLKKQHMMNNNSNNSGSSNDPVVDEPKPLACKILQKGVVFKDNVLYSPLKPHILKGEIDMLRTLAGECYCLKLHAVYESPKRLYVITDCCTGGVMTQYVAAQGSTFTTDDVSRIAYQLLSAIHHCAKYRILHRDIKPDNIMFTHPQPGADMRLIDFGSGSMDPQPGGDMEDKSDATKVQYVNGLRVHETFAGSAFYISPEVFNRSYTAMTDIWSVGATLYVLVAGYPADALQAAFNLLQCDARDLRKLPNLPNDLPDSFYKLLDGCLTYWYKLRPTAKKLLQYEFVTLHQKQDNGTDDVPDLSLPDGNVTNTMRRNNSISLFGSVIRHNLFLDFQRYELSVTTLLATLLSKSDLEQLLQLLGTRVKMDDNLTVGGASASTNNNDLNDIDRGQKLSVVPVADLKTMLRNDLSNTQV